MSSRISPYNVCKKKKQPYSRAIYSFRSLSVNPEKCVYTTVCDLTCFYCHKKPLSPVITTLAVIGLRKSRPVTHLIESNSPSCDDYTQFAKLVDLIFLADCRRMLCWIRNFVNGLSANAIWTLL